MRLLGLREIIGSLQVEPETWVGAEIASQPDRGIGADVARAAHDLGQAIGQNVQFPGERARKGRAERDIPLAGFRPDVSVAAPFAFSVISVIPKISRAAAQHKSAVRLWESLDGSII